MKHLTDIFHCPKWLLGAAAALGFGAMWLPADTAMPEDFPRCRVPGQEKAMETWRALFWHHYPGTGPKSTLWDEWLPAAALWPDVGSGGQADGLRRGWRDALSAREMDAEGYVATHQHASIAHPLGWPFPFWNQGQGGFGWHFSFKKTVGKGWRPDDLNVPDEWTLEGARSGGVIEDGWKIEVTNAQAFINLRAWTMDAYNVPFVQVRWSVSGLGDSQPYLEWVTPSQTNFAVERRVYFDAPPAGMNYTMIPVYRHPLWQGAITKMRIGLGNAQPSGTIVLQACFSTYDTRHNINGQNFIRGCAHYFNWTADLGFLRKNINRMRAALRYLTTEHQTLARKVVFTDWVGHDGRPGYVRQPDGKLKFQFGHGIGNNYWDIMPFGHLDAYATIQYYDALRRMIQIERDIRAHPEWLMPRSPLAFAPEFLEGHAAEVKAEGNRMFWNKDTGRFVACIDADGQRYDYGFTFLNLEAVYYDFATPAHARAIMSWITGERTVAGDTAQGAEIYHWRFAPRATTRRNLDWYFWAWNRPEDLPWGGQVQDGGAVLGFSYHDLMARLKTRGPDDAWRRLREILAWYDEVRAEGGYRKYYSGQREGTMQGAGTAGGLGIDKEFFESALVPQVVLYGFLGFEPGADRLRLAPRLPADWPEMTLDRIRYQGFVLRVRVAGRAIEVWKDEGAGQPLTLHLPGDSWKAMGLSADGAAVEGQEVTAARKGGETVVTWAQGQGLRLEPGKR